MNYYNSNIKRKTGICPDCTDGKIKTLIGGRCQPHYDKHRNAINAIKNKERQKSGRAKIIQLPSITKNPDLVDILEESIDLAKWFNDKMYIVAQNPYCQNCNDLIPPRYYKHAVAHIFPKSIFKSISTHPLNFVIAGAGCGCHNLTHRLDTFAGMQIWDLAVERFLIFKDLITEKHKYYNQFLDYALHI